jgi:hypothetical protein
VDFDFEWRVDDQPVSDLGSILLAERSRKGEHWTVRVTPHDGAHAGAPSELAVDIVNSPPSINAAVIDRESPLADSLLHCLAEGWTDADDDSELLQSCWLVNGTEVATGNPLESSYFASGDSVVCELTPDDGEALGAPVSSTAVLIGNALPQIDSPTLTSASITHR